MVLPLINMKNKWDKVVISKSFKTKYTKYYFKHEFNFHRRKTVSYQKCKV